MPDPGPDANGSYEIHSKSKRKFVSKHQKSSGRHHTNNTAVVQKMAVTKHHRPSPCELRQRFRLQAGLLRHAKDIRPCRHSIQDAN